MNKKTNEYVNKNMKITKKQYLSYRMLNNIIDLKNKLLDENRYKITEVNLQPKKEKKPENIIIEKNKQNNTKESISYNINNKESKPFNDIDYQIENRNTQLEKIKRKALTCTACDLCQSRKNVVFGEGNHKSNLMFIGEAPGEEEDIQGRPFVGKAGKLLTLMIKSIGLDRKDVYIANILKCRPPGNRNPHEDEIKTCTPYLLKQIELINPKVIVTLGNFSSKYILKSKKGITTIRGKLFKSNKLNVIPTFHPSYLLRNPVERIKVWKDMQLIRRTIDSL
jgi:uracil-DNA glycosylase